MNVYPVIHSFIQHNFIEQLLNVRHSCRHKYTTAYVLSKSFGMLWRVIRVMRRNERRGGSGQVDTQGRQP